MSISDLFIAEQDTDTERVCGTCRKLKPITEFYKDGRHSNGKTRYRRDCKDCYKTTRQQDLLKVAQGKKKGGT